MFTGIIKEVGKVRDLSSFAGGKKISIQATKTVQGIEIGESIAVNGACLSVTKILDNSFEAQAVKETLQRSNLSKLRKGSMVNLERPLQASDRFDGHFVQGHIDGTGKFIARKEAGDSALLKFSIPSDLSKYTVEKGSIALNGVSLTIAKKEGQVITISVIPLTLKDTNLDQLSRGDQVNIEVDILAKYVESSLGKNADQIDLKNGIKKWGYK